METGGYHMDKKENENKRKMRVTVRYSKDECCVIEDMAHRLGLSKAEFVRTASITNLRHYKKSIRIIDPEQAKEIKELIKLLFNEVSAVRQELHRIGVNYNQEIRLKQIERKYANAGMDVNAIFRQADETKAVMDECKGFSQKDIDGLIARYEKATEKVGRILCHILA